VIRRVFRGRSPYGLLSYLYGQGRRNEHANPHLVASWDGAPAALEPGSDAVRGTPAVGPLTRLLEQPVRGCDRLPERWVYHLVLRNDPGDRRLSDDEWAEVCAAAMSRTGIAPEGDDAACRWVAVRHADDHIHLVATLAREDGRPPRIWGDYARLAEVANEFEGVFGLRSTAGRDDRTATPRPGVKEQVTAEALGRPVAPRVVLRTKVKAAAAASTGFEDFTSRLAAAGVTVWPRMSEMRPDQMTGYSVSLNDWTNAAGEPVRFGGGKLAPDLSLPKLTARWGEQPAARRHPDRATAAGQQRTEAVPPVTGPDAERAWLDAERLVREAAARISADARTNPDAAADAAWAASDALTATAAGLEGDHGGPLTDAAEAFERAGRDCYRSVPERSDTGAALRATARTIALLTAGSRHPAGRTAMVTVALASLVAAVADLREAQQRLHQADAARAAAAHLRLGAANVPSSGWDASRPRSAAQQAALSFTRPQESVRPADRRPAGREPAAQHGDELTSRREAGGRGPARL
jgi:hypothetical protein